MAIRDHRRQLLKAIAGCVVAGPSIAAQLLETTPPQTPGPFYPDELPLDDDNDLTRVARQTGRARGAITDLSGRLLDLNGRPLRNARIEIWQCDANGRYHHPRDSRDVPLDPNFQGHGHSRTDVKGRYRFRTIRPVPYPGRTPHIHIAVLADHMPAFTTQLYIRDEPANEHDFLFRSVAEEKRHLVTADFRPASGDTRFRAEFDIVLGSADGTPQM